MKVWDGPAVVSSTRKRALLLCEGERAMFQLLFDFRAAKPALSPLESMNWPIGVVEEIRQFAGSSFFQHSYEGVERDQCVREWTHAWDRRSRALCQLLANGTGFPAPLATRILAASESGRRENCEQDVLGSNMAMAEPVCFFAGNIQDSFRCGAQRNLHGSGQWGRLAG